MVGTTRVAAVMDELFTRLSTHPELADVLVLDGPTVSGDVTRDVIVIGLGDDGTTADVMVSRTGPRSFEEQYEIGAVVSSFSGTGVTKTARDQVTRILAVLENMLTNDLTLGGVCGLIALGPTVLWRQIPTANGTQVRLSCTITVNVAL